MGKVKQMNEAEKPKLSMEEILRHYVKHKNGAIFQVLPHKTKKGKVLLRSKNIYREFDVLTIRQGLVNGDWNHVNEHEYRKWIKVDNEYVEKLTRKLVKRIILAQLQVEIDEDLIQDFENDRHFQNVLRKSIKESDRISQKNFERMYKVDKEMLTNFMNEIDLFTSVCSTFGVEEFFFLNTMILNYIDDPEKYQTDTVEITKID